MTRSKISNSNKDVINLFRLNERKQSNQRQNQLEILGTFFEHQEKDHYEPVRVANFWSDNYIEYEGNCNRNKTLSIEEYLDKVRPYILKGYYN